MATSYQKIVAIVEKHVNAMAGTSASAQETNFAVTPLTTTQVDDPIYNLSFAQALVINAHGRIALAIASAVDPLTGIGNHPWRGFFRDKTGALTHGANIPTVGGGGKSIIGAF